MFVYTLLIVSKRGKIKNDGNVSLQKSKIFRPVSLMIEDAPNCHNGNFTKINSLQYLLSRSK